MKKKFIDEPGQMKLLIVVDKLLTGFDAPPATYLYIDKQMRDHGLFQAICRVNRLDGDDKEYGYIIDYKDLFKSLEGAVHDYTSGALDGYDKEDVAGLLEDRLDKARERLEEAREAVKALCEPVEAPKDSAAYLRYFCAKESGNAEQLKANEPQAACALQARRGLRARLCQPRQRTDGGRLHRRRDRSAQGRGRPLREGPQRGEAGQRRLHRPQDVRAGHAAPDRHLHPGRREREGLGLRRHVADPAHRRARRGCREALPKGIRKNKEAVAETIENNVRRLIIDEQPINPKYYEKMSELLDALIEQRRQEALDYQEYLGEIVELTKKVTNPEAGAYPPTLNTPAKRALYDNLGKNEALALAMDRAVRHSRQDDWRSNLFKVKKVKLRFRQLLSKAFFMESAHLSIPLPVRRQSIRLAMKRSLQNR